MVCLICGIVGYRLAYYDAVFCVEMIQYAFLGEGVMYQINLFTRY